MRRPGELIAGPWADCRKVRAVQVWHVGDIEIIRVDDPGEELILPQDDATIAVLQASDWLHPSFVTDDWALRIGSSATVILTSDRIVVVDPFLAFDNPDLFHGRLAAIETTGVDAGTVDAVINTHVDGIGINLSPDGSPTFPAASYLVPRPELKALQDGTHGDSRGMPLLPLWDDDTVLATDGSEVVAPGVRLEDAPGHNPGHHVVWVEDGGQSAVIIGHLFLHPAQIANPENHLDEFDPDLLVRTRRALLTRCADRCSMLIGPLFAEPGGGTIEPDGDSWRLAV